MMKATSATTKQTATTTTTTTTLVCTECRSAVLCNNSHSIVRMLTRMSIRIIAKATPHRRALSSSSGSAEQIEPILDAARLQERLQALAPSMASSLASEGYWTNSLLENETAGEQIVSQEEVMAMREQSIALRKEGRFQQSMSETTTSTGEIREFPKEGVFACEPDGRDYYTAPDLLIYMSTLIGMLPPLLNDAYNQLPPETTTSASAALTLTNNELSLSNQAFNAKLAVTSPGGSVYPLHVDNTLGVKGSPQDDSRKLTFILYLNPANDHHVEGGELRLLVPNTMPKQADNDAGNNNSVAVAVDVTPVGGRVVAFWSDEIPHEVLPCAPTQDVDNAFYDRYALTVWIPDIDPRNIQPPNSKFQDLREHVFS